MIGAGIAVFAVWNYVITKAKAGVLEINPKMLAFTLGGKESEIEEALEYLQQPDPESRSKLEDGRRIIREGQFQYRLVNWEYYQQIRNEDDRREYNRLKQAEYRARKKGLPGTPEKMKERDARHRAESAAARADTRGIEGLYDGEPDADEIRLAHKEKAEELESQSLDDNERDLLKQHQSHEWAAQKRKLESNRKRAGA